MSVLSMIDEIRHETAEAGNTKERVADVLEAIYQEVLNRLVSAMPVELGSVTTGQAGTAAEIVPDMTTKPGTMILNFKLPQGASGLGKPGKDGRSISMYEVKPSDTEGKNGDLAVVGATHDLFVKSGDVWVPRGTLQGPEGKGEKGDPGATIHTGTIAPQDNFGKNNDLFFNLLSNELLQKTAGMWQPKGILKGEKGDSIKGDPGIAATVTVEPNITLVKWGEPFGVVNLGTSHEALLKFTLPLPPEQPMIKLREKIAIITPTDGETVVFEVAEPYELGTGILYYNGLRQRPNTDYIEQDDTHFKLLKAIPKQEEYLLFEAKKR